MAFPRRHTWMAGFWLAMAAGSALADEPPKDKPAEKPGPTVKVSGVIFPYWTLDLTDGDDDFNQFAIDRAYFRADAKITDAISARITLDAAPGKTTDVPLSDGTTLSVGDARYIVFLKHAWLAWKATPDIDVKGGMIDTPFIPFVENNQGTRWIAKTFLDDTGLESSADLGVNIAGKHAHGLFSWSAGVYNGETFKGVETGSGKSLQARATVDPLAGDGKKKTSLPISGFVDENLHEAGAPAKLTFAGDLGFRHPNFLFDGEIVGSSQATPPDSTSQLGESGQIAPGVPKIGYILLRVDHFDPSNLVDGDDYLKMWAGAAHDFYDKVSLGLFYQRQTTSSAPDAPTHGIYVRAQAGF